MHIFSPNVEVGVGEGLYDGCLVFSSNIVDGLSTISRSHYIEYLHALQLVTKITPLL